VERSDSLEAELARARELDVDALADAIESIGFECTRCGACCRGYETDDGREPHTATVFPDEVRRLQATAGEVGGESERDEDGGGTDGDGDEDGDGDDDDGGEVTVERDDDASGATGEPERGRESGGDRERGREFEYDWRDVARPVPFGLRDGPEGPEGETFEWALQTDDCGDCRFYEERDDGRGACTVHEDRPLVCRTYPFSVALAGTSQPLGDPVDEEGVVRAHECEGLGRSIDRPEAVELARTLRERAVRELTEAIALRDAYSPADPDPGEVVVHDSEGAKRPDGTRIDDDHDPPGSDP
jgi:hypothetical protein